jgi:hypothetical protein
LLHSPVDRLLLPAPTLISSVICLAAIPEQAISTSLGYCDSFPAGHPPCSCSWPHTLCFSGRDLSWAFVAHAYNPSYSGCRGSQFKASPGKQFHETQSQKNSSQKWADGMTQGEGPAFKPLYWKKATKGGSQCHFKETNVIILFPCLKASKVLMLHLE